MDHILSLVSIFDRGLSVLFPSPFSSLFISYLTLKGRKWASREREIMKITKIRLTWVMSKERSPVTKIGV